MEQKAWTLDKVTLKKIGKSALLVLGGTFLSFLSTNMVQIFTAFNSPAEYQVYLAGFFTWAINAVQEYIKGKQNE